LALAVRLGRAASEGKSGPLPRGEGTTTVLPLSYSLKGREKKRRFVLLREKERGEKTSSHGEAKKAEKKKIILHSKFARLLPNLPHPPRERKKHDRR